jgi:hypothetical protein
MTLQQTLEDPGWTVLWKRRAMCVSALERVAPVFRRFGRGPSQPTFEAILDAAWLALLSGRFRVSKADVGRFPETKADDSYTREYYANRVLLIVRRTIDCLDQSHRRSAERCLGEVIDLCGDCDSMLTSAAGQTYRYDPEKPTPPGRIETLEYRAQADILDLLRDANGPEPALIDSLRQLARGQASVYDGAVLQLRLV